MGDSTFARCGAQSRLVDEELRGTIPNFEAFHFLPVPGPWPQAVRPAEPDGFRLPPSTRLKTLYYRPYPGRPTTESPIVWDTYSRQISTRSADGAWHAAAPTTVPQFIGVCIHGRHDTCCGVRGGGFIRRVQQLVPDAPIYGVSHLGGDRFAPTAVLLPSGYLLGRLDDMADEDLRELVEEGLLPLAHLRGRLGVTPAEAVAEIWYREKFHRRDPADLPAISVVGPVGVGHHIPAGVLPARSTGSESLLSGGLASAIRKGSLGAASSMATPARPEAVPRYNVLVDDGVRRWRIELRREQRDDATIQYTCTAALSKPVYHWEVDVTEETDSLLAAGPVH
ncbi:sucrase ferredoxin [Pseudofrankia sp. BMG5.37]|uniref:sucrase ferredoxin n=1 Tax=Pseudofrankia sp. BMG5.37 TaxID=3050035 RepID=UPI002893FCE0|nr:sucrase ferredoxin [Pseudofrankia sp. BMG5.37]MDT3441370.1 sucrase ferredoxin [Pseudofrankia sp. BMG5.37]